MGRNIHRIGRLGMALLLFPVLIQFHLAAAGAVESATMHAVTFFGPGGYVFLPSAEVLSRGDRRTFVNAAWFSAPELEVTLQTVGVAVGAARGVEAGVSYRLTELSSPQSLGTGQATSHYRGNEMTLFTKYTPNIGRLAGRQYVDSAVTFGVSVTVVSMDGLSKPLRNIYESINEELGQKDGHPTFYVAYGGYRQGGGPATSLYLKLGDSLSLGLGFRSRILGGKFELMGEYFGTIYHVNESLLDRTQLSLGIRKRFLDGRAAVKLGMSTLEIDLAGTGQQANIRTTLDAYLVGLEFAF
ncbi:MAG: hypothetical protein QGH40_03445 [bacterium]|nr:hypothetical protein [bacterium]